MCSLSVPRHGKFEHYLRSHRTQTFFPISSLFANMDHLFWRVTPKMDDHQFAWILWYIWKARNNKDFNNLDIDPREMLNLAELESTLWTEAQVINTLRLVHEAQNIPN